MAQLPIKRSIERVPGGMMIVPLLIGSLVATFLPGMPKFFGSFTSALFTGALPILAVFYVCMGASIDVKATPYLLKKGGAILSFKSLDAGRLVVRWSSAPTTVRGKKTKAMLVAQGRMTFEHSGTKTVYVRLTAAGRRVLRHAKRVRLTAKGTFTRTNAKPIVGTKGFVVTRGGATTTP